jgi:hypothetical protein
VTALGAWNLYSAQLESPTWIEVDTPFQPRNQRRNRNTPTEKQYDDVDDDGNPDHVPIRQPTHTACATTDGVYHISIADI